MRPLTALLVKRQAFYSSRDPFADLPSANPNACICKLSHSASVFVPSALLRYCVTIATASQNFLSDSFFLIFCFFVFSIFSLLFKFIFFKIILELLSVFLWTHQTHKNKRFFSIQKDLINVDITVFLKISAQLF